MKKIRVLVVDDSALMRKMIPQILMADPDIEVAGTAIDGTFALQKISSLSPDVITLDVDMPRMGGIETLRHIVEDHGIPTIMVSSLTTAGVELTLQALEIGAFDFVTKPKDAISVHIGEIGNELIEKVKAAYRNPLRKIRRNRVASALPPLEKSQLPSRKSAEKVLAIGTSTGGPNVLTYLLPQIPKDFPAAIVIVQHMPAGFTEMFASRLNAISMIEVREAKDGDLVLPGRALIAPGDRHMKVRRLPLGTIAVLSGSEPVNGHRPSVDVLFNSIADEYGQNATALIMTGMGSDGAHGIGKIRANGGTTLAQDEASCVVFGMPKAAIENKYITKVLELDTIGDYLIANFMNKEEINGKDK